MSVARNLLLPVAFGCVVLSVQARTGPPDAEVGVRSVSVKGYVAADSLEVLPWCNN